jgi:uncharacterized tellurite resistance protein B-like protein
VLRALRTLLQTGKAEVPRLEQDPQHAVRLATAALFVELMRSDFEILFAEQRQVLRSVERTLDLTRDEAEELLEMAETAVDDSVSLYDFTQEIHGAFTLEQKVAVLEGLWRIAFADGSLSHLEEHMLRKVKGLLHIGQKDYIAAKQRAREAVQGS